MDISIALWNYPFSVDGNIFFAGTIKKVISAISFKAPNSLEGEMHGYRKTFGFAWKFPYGLATGHAAIFNNPLNKVQSEGETWHQGISVEDLNRQYIDGKEIDNQPLYACTPNAVHYAAPISFVNRI